MCHLDANTTRQLLPKSLREVAGQVPLAAILALVRCFGGQKLYIPLKPGPKCRLAKAIGIQHARAIGRALGHGEYEVPTCRRLAHRKRAELIFQRYCTVKSYSKVAAEFGLHYLTVSRIVRAEQKRRALPDLTGREPNSTGRSY